MNSVLQNHKVRGNNAHKPPVVHTMSMNRHWLSCSSLQFGRYIECLYAYLHAA